MASYTKKVLFINFLVLFLFILDRASKWLAMNLLSREGVFIMPKTIGFVLERNQGIAYSIPISGITLIVTVLLILALLVFILFRNYQRREIIIIFSLTLIIVGAFSNFLDRLRYDYVVDFITLTGWPVFNLADAMITAGVVIMIVKVAKGRKGEKQ